MADKPEAEHLDEEEEGGPVKSFLDHLEDLRWVLIKSIVALGLAMLVCLLAGNYVVEIIKRPLTKARISFPGTNQVVTVRVFTNQIGTFHLSAEQGQAFDLGTNRFVAVQIEPVTIGTNRLLTWRIDPDPAAA